MSKLLQILNALIATEQRIVPIFVHNPNSQNITGIILAGEEVAAEFVSGIVAANTSSTANPATTQSTAAPAA